MKTVRVRLGARSYTIYIGKGVIGKLTLLIEKEAPAGAPLFVVTNAKIKRLHGKSLKNALRTTGRNVLFSVVPDSEKAKSFPVYIKTIRTLARFSQKVKPVVVAFGGGVIGDLAGFVASAYRRGVPYVQIPTTLLAQVDSAIGGKVAIDIKEAKNIVGNFYQPRFILSDTDFLKTLPKKELRNGLAEVVKYGIIKDRQFFLYLEKNLKKVLKLDPASLEHIIFKSCEIKARVVEKDELDTKDVRAVLNFGHTLGHAIEAASRYSGQIVHGQAVAAGMIMASFIALNLKMLKENEHRRICALIKKVFPKISAGKIRLGDVMSAVAYDKKFIYGVNRFILPEGIGHVKIVDGIRHELIKRAVKKSLV